MTYKKPENFGACDLTTLVLGVDTYEEAQQLLHDYFQDVGRQTLEHELTAPELVKWNIGYALGYGATLQQIEIWWSLGVQHPIFGEMRISELKPEWLINAGVIFGEARRDGKGLYEAAMLAQTSLRLAQERHDMSLKKFTDMAWYGKEDTFEMAHILTTSSNGEEHIILCSETSVELQLHQWRKLTRIGTMQSKLCQACIQKANVRDREHI